MDEASIWIGTDVGLQIRAILPIGANARRPRSQSSVARTRHPEDVSVASALDDDLGRLKTGALGGWLFLRPACSAGVAAADPGQTLRGVRHGRQPAVRRRR